MGDDLATKRAYPNDFIFKIQIKSSLIFPLRTITKTLVCRLCPKGVSHFGHFLVLPVYMVFYIIELYCHMIIFITY